MRKSPYFRFNNLTDLTSLISNIFKSLEEVFLLCIVARESPVEFCGMKIAFIAVCLRL